MGNDGRMWLKRKFSWPGKALSEVPAPVVPLVIQEWIEARVQIAAEQSKSAAFRASELQEIQLAAAVEEVAARCHAQMARTTDSIRENSERRHQIGTLQAMSHAEQGVAALGSALKGVAQALASVKRELVSAAASKQATESAILGIRADLNAIQAASESGLDGFDAQLAAVAAGIESAVSDNAALVSKIAGHDDQIASVAAEIGSAVSDYNAQLRSVEKRVEFVRQETMYELQASLMQVGGSSRGEEQQPKAMIVNPEKVEKMRASGLRLNIGCGHIQNDDYINVDARQLPGVDVVAQAQDIPFASEEIQEISSSHLVEHFTSHILDRVLLPYWKSLLKPGGQLTTVAPDGAAMLAAVNNGTMSFEDFREVLFGAQDYDGDFHYNLITPESFSDTLKRAGFVGIEAVYTEKKNGKCFEFKIIARKP